MTTKQLELLAMLDADEHGEPIDGRRREGYQAGFRKALELVLAKLPENEEWSCSARTQLEYDFQELLP